jgi:hypothetical protein
MSDYADKSQKNKNRPIVDGVLPQQGEDNFAFHLADSRTETIVQRKLQENINDSPHVRQMKALRHMVGSSLQVKQAKTYQAMADNYALRKEKEPAVLSKDGRVKSIFDKKAFNSLLSTGAFFFKCSMYCCI